MASDQTPAEERAERSPGPLRAVRQFAVGYFETRFADLFSHVTNESRDTRRLVRDEAEGHRRLLETNVEKDQRLLRDASDRLQPGVAALVEAAVYLEQTAGRLEDELRREASALIAAGHARDIHALLAKDHALGHSLVEIVAALPLAELPPWVAELANLFDGHRSPLADAGLWINEPVSIRALPGGAEVGSVNERIVEIPYVLAAAAAAPPGAVVDLGAAESTVSLSLASGGRRTYALDPRGYPFEHPLLEVVASPVRDWAGPDEPVSVVISLSTVEHLASGSFSWATPGPDLEALDVLAGWLAPDGILVLTAPYGGAAADDVRRGYDATSLPELLDGWEVTDLRFARRLGPTAWETCGAEDLAGAEVPGVVLLQARRPA